MRITSPAFSNNQPVPLHNSCKGPNVSPPLEFLEAPKETKSFALIMEDADSPNHWIHWLVYNIPAHIQFLEEGKIPKDAIDGVCNGGTHGYEGPCPKYFAGIHQYKFTLYALDIVLEAPYEADSKVILELMHNHILTTAQLIGIAQGELQDAYTNAETLS